MRVSLLLVACASAQVHHKFHDGKRLVTAKYPTLAAATEWKAASETCPVRCQWDGRKVRTEHLLKHGKMIEWVPGASPDENINRIYHKCWHEAKTGVCTCECAHWDVDDCDVGSQVCATACGQSASIMKGTPASVEDIGCFYGSDQLNDNQCLASDKPSTCTTECPATVACPTSSPTPAPTTAPTPAPTNAPTSTPTDKSEWRFTPKHKNELRDGLQQWCQYAASHGKNDVDTWDSKYSHPETWNTALVTDLDDLFELGTWQKADQYRYLKIQCNPPIGNWDTSNVKSMRNTFKQAAKFNQPIGNWDTSNVIDTYGMFDGAQHFNQPIGNWNVEKVENMDRMFRRAYRFDQSLENWKVSSTCRMFKIFDFYDPIITIYELDSKDLHWNWGTPKVRTIHSHNCRRNSCTDYDKLQNPRIIRRVSKKGTGGRIWKNYKNPSWFVFKPTTREFDPDINAADAARIKRGDRSDPLMKAYSSWNYQGLRNRRDQWACQSPMSRICLKDKPDSSGYYEEAAVAEAAAAGASWNRIMYNDHIERLGPVSTWDMSGCESFARMLSSCSSETDALKGMENWDTSNVRDMENFALGAQWFNEPIGNWDMSKVGIDGKGYPWPNSGGKMYCDVLGTDCPENTHRHGMKYAFDDCNKFNQPINWDTSGVKNFYSMFGGTRALDQPINLQTDSAENMHSMFYNSGFEGKGNFADWDVSKVINMQSMFAGAHRFNAPGIVNWDTSQVQNFKSMFYIATAFNQPIGIWDISNARHVNDMFVHAKSFDQDLTSWDLTNVGKDNMFKYCPISQSNKPRGTR